MYNWRSFDVVGLDTGAAKIAIGNDESVAYSKIMYMALNSLSSLTVLKSGSGTHLSTETIVIQIPLPNSSFMNSGVEVVWAVVYPLLVLNMLKRHGLIVSSNMYAFGLSSMQTFLFQLPINADRYSCSIPIPFSLLNLN